MTSELTHAVPAYFHPAVAPGRWRRLVSQVDRTRFVIINPHNGVGEGVEQRYSTVVSKLQAAGAQLVGYADTAYGERPVEDLADEARAFQSRYGINGIFLDQCSTSLEMLDIYEKYAMALRTVGTRFLVMNPGAHPHRGYIDLANVTVTFEGSWQEYRDFEEPDWITDRPASRFCHFVYGVPRKIARAPEEIVGDRHVGSVCFTDGDLPNPWDRIPPALRGR